MGRGELERLSKEELIELVLKLQRPEKTSRTSSKPPSTDRKEQRECSKPGGAKPGHEGRSRVMSEAADEVVEHRPGQCFSCGAALAADLPAEAVSVHERIDVPEVTVRAGLTHEAYLCPRSVSNLLRNPALCRVLQGLRTCDLPESAPAIGSQTFMRLP
jgi:hypothetical protein